MARLLKLETCTCIRTACTSMSTRCAHRLHLMHTVCASLAHDVHTVCVPLTHDVYTVCARHVKVLCSRHHSIAPLHTLRWRHAPPAMPIRRRARGQGCPWLETRPVALRCGVRGNDQQQTSVSAEQETSQSTIRKTCVLGKKNMLERRSRGSGGASADFVT